VVKVEFLFVSDKDEYSETKRYLRKKQTNMPACVTYILQIKLRKGDNS